MNKIAIVYPGDHQARRDATHDNNRFSAIFRALADVGLRAEPAVYNDDFCDEVRRQLMGVDGVLVWVNPVENGRDRSILDGMLRQVADAGVFVSAHPDVILKMGTKEVLYRTRDLAWGCDTHLYLDGEQIRRGLTERLAQGKPRVLKQYRGNGGNGVWKVELAPSQVGDRSGGGESSLRPETQIRVRHAKRGGVAMDIMLADFLAQCEQYLCNGGKLIDQEYQPRLTEGMIRCYLVHDRVAGFGHQAINALYPEPVGAPRTAAPQPGPRLYHPPHKTEFQTLKTRLELEWVPAMQRLLDLDTGSLPVLWDADFLLGPKSESGEDSYILCEINASSVAPFPASAVAYVAEAALARMRAAASYPL